MTDLAAVTSDSLAALRAVVEKHWGYRTFRPLQEEAMRALLAARDSLVVMPTGGGKSLCYQAPALLRSQAGGGPTVVVSPLISLMKDQVDSLRANGVPAAHLDSSLSSAERSAIFHEMRQGALHLLFVSPERLVMPAFQNFLHEVGARCFVIDEAHCISHWGHDFRPEYRQLSQLKTLFPGASVHAFTATATRQVRTDIIEQLNLHDPELLVGNFDRPNLVYRVIARRDQTRQIQEVLDRHKDEAGIIYCIRRKDVDELTETLAARGHKVQPYHAGLTPDQRRKAQDAFTGRGRHSCDLIVATVAFGMGIDRSDIRFVLHTAMPKSVEAYQQETGRAGRDGLEADCVLLYSGQDYLLWKSIIERSAAEAVDAGIEVDPSYVSSALRHLDDMDRYARGAVCRHQALVEYFGQSYAPPSLAPVSSPPAPDSCQACDLCLGETELVPDALIIAQKILSCVARVDQRFGAGHVIGVLRGENTERIRSMGHDQLPTYGLLAEHDKSELRDFIYQLLGQKVLVQEGAEYPVLRLNRASWEVMKKQREIRLVRTVRRKKDEKRSRAETISWEGVDQTLFETLRALRRELAAERSVPPYVIFSDATLRELARIRPSAMDRLALIYGVGQAKLRDFGPRVLPLILSHCRSAGLPTDVTPSFSPAAPVEPRKPRPNAARDHAFDLFRSGASLDDVAAATQRTRHTVTDYLCDFIQETRPASVAPWVSDRAYHRILDAARQIGSTRLRPLFDALGQTVSYEDLRIVLAHADAVR